MGLTLMGTIDFFNSKGAEYAKRKFSAISAPLRLKTKKGRTTVRPFNLVIGWMGGRAAVHPYNSVIGWSEVLTHCSASLQSYFWLDGWTHRSAYLQSYHPVIL